MGRLSFRPGSEEVLGTAEGLGRGFREWLRAEGAHKPSTLSDRHSLPDAEDPPTQPVSAGSVPGQDLKVGVEIHNSSCLLLSILPCARLCPNALTASCLIFTTS